MKWFIKEQDHFGQKMASRTEVSYHDVIESILNRKSNFVNNSNYTLVFTCNALLLVT